MHPITVLVNKQIDVKLFFSYICLLQFSTCFEQPCAHHQESQLYQYDLWYMSLYIGDRRPLGRPRRRWVDNIRMDLQEVEYGYMDWIGLAQNRDSWRMLVGAVMKLRVPWNAGNFLTSCLPVSFPSRTLHHGVSKCICDRVLCIPHGHIHRLTYTRGRIDMTDSPDDEHTVARNM